MDNYFGPATLDCVREAKHPIRILTGSNAQTAGDDFKRALKDMRKEGKQVKRDKDRLPLSKNQITKRRSARFIEAANLAVEHGAFNPEAGDPGRELGKAAKRVCFT